MTGEIEAAVERLKQDLACEDGGGFAAIDDNLEYGMFQCEAVRSVLARHREAAFDAAIERAAGVAEARATGLWDGDDIAAAIRALKTGEK